MRLYRLVSFVVCFFLCLNICAQNSFKNKQIRFLSNGCSVERAAFHTFTIIKHKMPYKIKLEPSYASKWVSWDIKNDTVFIDVKGYENGSVRNCKLIAYSKDGKNKDTYIIKEEIKNKLVDRCIYPIYFPSRSISWGTESMHRTIFIRSTIPFSVRLEPANASKWVTYNVKGDSIEIDVKENNAREGRRCEIIAFSKDKKYSDSYYINQKGTSLSYSTSQTTEKSISNRKKSISTNSSKRNITNTFPVQCHGRTKSGTRCSRRVSGGEVYCWQHRK